MESIAIFNSILFKWQKKNENSYVYTGVATDKLVSALMYLGARTKQFIDIYGVITMVTPR